MVQPKSFFLKGGERAVLLLHSFTSNPRDMRPLGRYLNEKGYTCFAPIYKGHGLPPEQLIRTNPDDWWESVKEGYDHLRAEGHQNIAVIGVSLGGIFALDVGQKLDVNGIVAMSVPNKREVDSLKRRVTKFAKAYKQLEGIEEQQIKYELAELEKQPFTNLVIFQDYINSTMRGLDNIHKPLSIMYGELDEPLYKESAKYIDDHVSTNNKRIKSYPHSNHLMTLGKDQDMIHSDVLSFLESLQW
ncbi:alpha/beta fold hydrolase [Bacillus sp. JCM 19041]|uniref:alpha/beta hydrolase n=1 Tax=Bacillus sp. JCM 19041 TaxID=1460637 RepID=UPI000B336301